MASAPDDPSTRWLRGMLESCVVGILRSGPAYGYDIAGRIAQVGFARPKGGTLYPILARLERDGLVEPTWIEGEGGPSRKYYGLTESGMAAAVEIAREWTLFSDRMGSLVAEQPTRSKS